MICYEKAFDWMILRTTHIYTSFGSLRRSKKSSIQANLYFFVSHTNYLHINLIIMKKLLLLSLFIIMTTSCGFRPTGADPISDAVIQNSQWNPYSIPNYVDGTGAYSPSYWRLLGLYWWRSLVPQIHQLPPAMVLLLSLHLIDLAESGSRIIYPGFYHTYEANEKDSPRVSTTGWMGQKTSFRRLFGWQTLYNVSIKQHNIKQATLSDCES